MRFYGFDAQEIVNDQHPNLDLDIDPKLSWALRNPEHFPVDIQHADYRMILRVPGIGVQSAKKIVQARRFGQIHIDQLKRMGIAYNRAQHFIRCADTPKFKRTTSEPDSAAHFAIGAIQISKTAFASTGLRFLVCRYIALIEP
jgi:predicted DNA-binding helix-hairpin-helix protein